MKSLLLLWQVTAANAAVRCRTSADRDSKRIAARFEHEGVEVLTLTLPEIGKAFEQSLDQSQVSSSLLSLCGKEGGFPILMRDLLSLVFDRNSLRLLDEPSVEAINAIRQLTLMFGKVGLPCRQDRVDHALAMFVECELSVTQTVSQLKETDLASFKRISSILLGDVLTRMDRKVYNGEVVPKHGPGATADKLRNNAKYRQKEWTDRLEGIFPAGEFLLPNWRYRSCLDSVDWLEPGAERPARVVTVPKTLKTPRIIAIEPTCMQYVQQGLMEIFVDCLESDKLVSSMTGFTDQTPNQRLACEGSLEGDLATLDLSEASDRVPNVLVETMLENTPWLAKAVDSCRTRSARLPGERGHIPLSKFASMGSALTFPIEECIFLCTIFHGIESALSRQLTRRDIKSLIGRVRVYGDDLIVPVEYVRDIVRSLELFGFKVNLHKSFWTGKFRESCGREYYDGNDVSVVRCRKVLPSRYTDFEEIISTVSLRNQMYFSGYWGVARYLDDLLEALIPFPTVGEDSPVLGRHSLLGYYGPEGYDSDLQIPVVRGMHVRTRAPVSKLEDEGALLKWFLKRGDEPYAEDHLERQGRPEAVGIKLGWSRSY